VRPFLECLSLDPVPVPQVVDVSGQEGSNEDGDDIAGNLPDGAL